MLRIAFLLSVSISWAAISFCQKVELLNLNQLNERIRNGRDTVYIVNFWATWCVPCIKELPDFEDLQQEFKYEKLKVILMSVDYISTINTSVKPFFKNRKLLSEVFVLNEKSQQDYIERVDKNWSGGIPASLFIHQSKRNFVEKEFTLPELIKEYQNTKKL